MKAERQQKESQKAEPIQSKRERSKLNFVDNRSQTASQTKLLKSIQKKENLSDYSIDDMPIHLKLGGNVVQRAVGMEFQTVGGKRNVFGISSRVAENSYVGNAEAPSTIREFNGFKITVDAKTDLEYITSPSDNRDEVVRRASEAGNTHLAMKDNNDQKITVTYQDKPYNNCFFYNCHTAINRDGEQTAHPQATIGIKLTGIPDLIEFLSTDSIKVGGTKPAYAEIQKKSFSKVSDKSQYLENVSDRCKGLITLLEQYIDVANRMFFMGYKKVPGDEGHYIPINESAQINLTKDTMPIMARTSISNIYKSLSIEEQTQFLNYFSRNYPSPEQTLVTFRSKSIKERDLDKSKTSTLNQYLSEIRDNNQESGTWDVNNFDGIDGGIALELRALERNVTPDRWGEVAGAVFDAVCSINSRNTDETT